MEKYTHRMEYSSLLDKQKKERLDLRDKAHEEALVINEAISERERSVILEGSSYKIVALSEMDGEFLVDVYKYLRETQGKDKFAERISFSLKNLPEELKVKNRKYFLYNNLILHSDVSHFPDGGHSQSHHSHENPMGRDEVEFFFWSGEEWIHSETRLGNKWDVNSRVFMP